MEYRIDRENLLEELAGWNAFLKRRVHVIACGGTALTMLGIKASTKDIDFMVPDLAEHAYLVKTPTDLGYRRVTGSGFSRDGRFIFDLFRGNRIHTTELLDTPLRDGGHVLYKEFTYLYVGILNVYDLMISKLFRGTETDFEDCLALVTARQDAIILNAFEKRYRETATYDVATEKMLGTLELFLQLAKKERLHGK